jgi:membrane protease YdiL (CAAX protease family)
MDPAVVGVARKVTYPRLRQAIGLVLLLLGAQVVVGLALGVAWAVLGLRHRAGDPVEIGLGNVVSFGIVLVWAWRRARQPDRDVFLLRGFRLILLVPLTVLVAGLGIIVSEMDNVFRFFVPVPGALVAYFHELTMSGAASLVTLGVVAPITEELFFRGVILRGLLGQFRSGKAIVVAAAMFSVYHVVPYQLLGAFAAGVVLGWVFVRTGSLWPCIIGHALYNTHVQILTAVLGIEIPGYSSGALGVVEFQPVWFDMLGVAATVAGLIGVAWTARVRTVGVEQAGAGV